MIMKKSTLLATFGAAALLNVACASTPEPAPAPAAEPAAAEPAAAEPAAPAEGEKAPEGSCGGEKKSEG
jgi:cytochrome c5